MNFSENTKLSEIVNAKTIAERTKKDIDFMLSSYTLVDFVETNKKSGELELKTQSLSTICGMSAGAIANQIKARKGTIYERLGDFFATWSKDAGKLSATEIAKQAENTAKIAMAKNMLLAKLSVEQIAKITGLSVEDINNLNA